MTAHADLIVIGGGLIGLSTALAAADRGMRVTLLEAETCGRHASSANAGGVRSLNRHPAEIPLARAALAAWRDLPKRLGSSCGFHAGGQLRVAEDAAALARLGARAEATRALGWTHERMISRAALRERVPALAPHCLGALVVDDDGFADPLATLRAYLAACRVAGVRLLERTPTRAVVRADAGGVAVETDTGTLRAPAVANCAGAWGGALCAGEPVPMRTAALQMIVTGPVAPFVSAVVGSEGRKLSLKQTDAGAVVIGGAFEGRVAPGPRGIVLGEPLAASLANVHTVFPHLADAAVVRAWAGLEGMVADGLPVLGPSGRVPGLVHAFGFSAHGFALAPVVGPLVADLVAGRAPRLPIAPFSIARFDAKRLERDRLERDPAELDRFMPLPAEAAHEQGGLRHARS